MQRAAVLLTFFWLAGPTLPARAQAELDYGHGLDVPYVVTPQPVVRAMLRLAGVKPDDTVVDLGCGDGRIVITAATEFGASGLGYDLDPRRIKEARKNAARAGVKNKAQFIQHNLFAAPISQATVVTLYLTPSVNEKLRPRLMAELKPGTRIVSHDFLMGDWTPEQTVEVDGHKIYRWTIPGADAGEVVTPEDAGRSAP